MDLTEGSETSAKLNLTPEKYPKENIQVSKHGENLKSRILNIVLFQPTMQSIYTCIYIVGLPPYGENPTMSDSCSVIDS
jgi:hypothetical protein